MSVTAASGGYESALASVSLVFGIAVFGLFLANKHLYPLAQREPVLALTSNVANTFLICMWLYENQYPELPLVERKVTSQICFGVIFVGFLVRCWKLYMDAGLTNERVSNKFGWFIAHRHYRSPRFLFKLTTALWLFHVVLGIIVCFFQPESNLKPARDAVKNGTDSLLVVVVIACYWLSFVVFSVLLAKTKEGFFIKLELRLVGLGSGSCTLMWFIKASMNLPCDFPSCSVMILWISWLWMLSCSIGIPLFFAMRDPRFSWTRCFTEIPHRKWKTDSASMSSTNSREKADDDFPSYHEMPSAEALEAREPPPLVRELSAATVARLKTIPLAKFLTFPPGKEAFREFTVQEFSVENLLFIEAVQQLATKPSLTKADLKVVYDQYVAPSGPSQVNLPMAIVQRLDQKIESAEPGEANLANYFEECTKHVMKLMQRDAFKRFQQTSAWQKHVVVFDVPGNQAAPSSNVELASTVSSTPLLSSVAPRPDSAPARSEDEESTVSAAPSVESNVQVLSPATVELPSAPASTQGLAQVQSPAGDQAEVAVAVVS